MMIRIEIDNKPARDNLSTKLRSGRKRACRELEDNSGGGRRRAQKGAPTHMEPIDGDGEV
jgi:hypothetical protein